MNIYKRFILCRSQGRQLFIALVLIFFVTQVFAADYFAINIGSSLTQGNVFTLNDPVLAKKYTVYAVKTDVDGITRYRQRLGFFNSREQARAVLLRVSTQFPGAWIDKVSADESTALNNWLSTNVIAPAVEPAAATTSMDAPSVTPLPEPAIVVDLPKSTTVPVTDPAANAALLDAATQHLADLMEAAKTALLAKDYAPAIQIYQRVISAGNSPYQREAQEFLGVVRERNGQLAHATAEYKTYLKLDPEGEDAARVQQRLNGLLTATDSPKEKITSTTKTKESAYWEAFGTAYQYYDRDTVTPANSSSIVANSLLTSGVNYSSRYLNGDYKMRTNFSALHIYDFLAGETDQTRINDMYFDMISPEQIFDTRIGRQKGRSSGVVGRFDGVDLGYRFNPSHQIKLITGYPVDFAGSSVAHETDKHFISLGYNWSRFLPNWEANFFILQQVADGVTDRQEVGSELRYRTPEQSFFSMLDYSTAFSEINYLMMVYNLRMANQSSFDVIADYRKSPFLTTSSALQGQTGVSTMADLVNNLTEQQLAQLAIDRTGVYKSLTTLYSRPLKENLEFNADFSVSNLSGTDATAASGSIIEVAAQEGTGNEYSYGLGLVKSNLFTENDINILHARFSQLFNADAISITGSAKYRVHTDWRIGPRLLWEQRHYDDGRDTSKVSPSFRAEYRQNKNWQYESEITYATKSTTTTTGTSKESSYFIHLGYYFLF